MKPYRPLRLSAIILGALLFPLTGQAQEVTINPDGSRTQVLVGPGGRTNTVTVPAGFQGKLPGEADLQNLGYQRQSDGTTIALVRLRNQSDVAENSPFDADTLATLEASNGGLAGIRYDAEWNALDSWAFASERLTFAGESVVGASAGYSAPEITLYDLDGQIKWSLNLQGSGENVSITGVTPTPDGDFLVRGTNRTRLQLGDSTLTYVSGEQVSTVFYAVLNRAGEWVWGVQVPTVITDPYFVFSKGRHFSDRNSLFVYALEGELRNSGGYDISYVRHEFDLADGQLRETLSSTDLPEGFIVDETSLAPSGDLFANTETDLIRLGKNGEVTFFTKGLLAQIEAEAATQGFDNGTALPGNKPYAIRDIDHFSNGDIIVKAERVELVNQRRFVRTMLALVSRDGTLQSVNRGGDLGRSFGVTDDDRLLIERIDGYGSAEILPGFVATADAPPIFSGTFYFERTAGPMSGLANHNGWQHHSDLGWVYPISDGWSYSHGMGAHIWMASDAPAGNFWTYNSSTTAWTFVPADNGGWVYDVSLGWQRAR